MVRTGMLLLGLLPPVAAVAQSPVAVHATYQTFAAGLNVATVETGLSLGPWNYQVQLAYHTTGMVGFFYNGHQHDAVNGNWNGNLARPVHFLAEGYWRRTNRTVELDYEQGHPRIRQLVPPNDQERESVPDTLQDRTVDTLSALVQLIRVVANTGRCDTSARTYDGRRLVEIQAHTVGEETLPQTDRSNFAGKAMRCDFEGRMLSGFLHDDNRERDSRPMHGSAWLAQALPGTVPMPVRMTFETRWFGDATMYLTDIGRGADIQVAQGN